MLGALVALALWRLGDEGNRDLHFETTRSAGWRLEMRRDRFTATTHCSLRKSGVSVGHGLVTFRFDTDVDTADALFSLDAGPPRPVSSVLIEAAGLGARLSRPNLANPSNGEVRIPLAELGSARSVAIKPNPNMQHRVFDISGLQVALEAAKIRKCDLM